MTNFSDAAIDLACGALSILLAVLLFVAIAKSARVYAALKYCFLVTWGLVALGGPVYSFFAISIPSGNALGGGIASIACLLAVGTPFVMIGWPKLTGKPRQ